MSGRHDLRYLASIYRLLLGFILLPCLLLLHHADGVRVCLEPSDPTCPSPRRPPGWPEDSLTEIELAFTGSSIPRPRPSFARLGFAHPRRLQDSDASESLCFWLVFPARSERSHV